MAPMGHRHKVVRSCSAVQCYEPRFRCNQSFLWGKLCVRRLTTPPPYYDGATFLFFLSAATIGPISGPRLVSPGSCFFKCSAKPFGYTYTPFFQLGSRPASLLPELRYGPRRTELALRASSRSVRLPTVRVAQYGRDAAAPTKAVQPISQLRADRSRLSLRAAAAAAAVLPRPVARLMLAAGLTCRNSSLRTSGGRFLKLFEAAIIYYGSIYSIVWLAGIVRLGS